MAQPLLEQIQWYTVHDTVMGGRSQGSVLQSKDAVLFKGYLSLENNGGFASIRTVSLPESVNEAMGIRIKLIGDGRTYLATLRLENSDRRIYFRTPIVTPAEQVVILEVPFASYRPFAYGRSVPQVPSILCVNNPIASLGFMLADKREGGFSLEILSMEFYDARLQPPKVSEQYRKALRAAVAQGVPQYNRGDISACAATYNDVLQGIQKEIRNPWLLHLLENQPQKDDEKAWWLRHIIDKLLE